MSQRSVSLVGPYGLGNARRTAKALMAVALVTSILLSISAIVRTADAHAFAWKDSCSISVYNRTGSQSSVRPYLYLPFPPSPIGLALYAALAAAGVPTNQVPTFTNTGFPITGGCTASLRLSNPGSNVACGAAAPTVGANAFNCDGNSSFKITQDNDDISGNVYIPKGTQASAATTSTTKRLRSATAGASSAASNPATKGLLHRGDLGGRGWHKATKLQDFGRLGQLIEGDTLPASCEDSRSAAQKPQRGGSAAYVRGHGSEAIGSLHGVYATVAAARQTLGEAVSPHGIGCLSSLLTSAHFQTHVTQQRLSIRALGPGIILRRLIVRGGSGGRTDYLDIAALRHVRSNALVLFANTKRPTPSGTERAVIRRVRQRLP